MFTLVEGVMVDNPKDRGPRDRARININEDWEVRYWTKELQVSEEELRAAVAKVGSLSNAVRKELGRVQSAG